MDDPKTQACQWKYCEHECSWDTQCDNKYVFMNDGPKENDYKFCPGCGKPVTLAGDEQPASVEPEELKALASATGSAPDSQDRDQYFRDNKWGVRIIKRGGDYDVAMVVKCLGFPDEQILGRAMWPDHANTICEEHNDSLAKALFVQDAKAQNR